MERGGGEVRLGPVAWASGEARGAEGAYERRGRRPGRAERLGGGGIYGSAAGPAAWASAERLGAAGGAGLRRAGWV